VLALGLVQAIIQNRWYDAPFVEAWCHGFARLAGHLQHYTPGYVAEATGIPAEQLLEVARLYALQCPSALFTGRGIDQIGRNSVPLHHSLDILRAITGNIDRKGASCITGMPDFIPELEWSE